MSEIHAVVKGPRVDCAYLLFSMKACDEPIYPTLQKPLERPHYFPVPWLHDYLEKKPGWRLRRARYRYVHYSSHVWKMWLKVQRRLGV